MTVKLTYRIPAKDLLVFTHLKSNLLTVTINTDMIDTVNDLRARIVDEILRKYSICLTKFQDDFVYRWDDVRRTAMKAVLSRMAYEWETDLGGYQDKNTSLETPADADVRRKCYSLWALAHRTAYESTPRKVAFISRITYA